MGEVDAKNTMYKEKVLYQLHKFAHEIAVNELQRKKLLNLDHMDYYCTRDDLSLEVQLTVEKAFDAVIEAHYKAEELAETLLTDESAVDITTNN